MGLIMKLYEKYNKPPFKYRLTQNVDFKPRFDNDYWLGQLGRYQSFKIIGNPSNSDDRCFDAVITIYKHFPWNGLTKHKDHNDKMLASALHDCLLGENMSYDCQFYRACVDRLFLSAMLDKADEGKTKWIRFRRRVTAYTHYWPVKIYSIVRG